MEVTIDMEQVLTFLSIAGIVIGAAIAIIKSYSKLNVTLVVIQKDIVEIQKDMIEIKADNSNRNQDVQNLSAKVVKIEASTKSAHKRLDDLTGVKVNEENEEVG